MCTFYVSLVVAYGRPVCGLIPGALWPIDIQKVNVLFLQRARLFLPENIDLIPNQPFYKLNENRFMV